MGTVLRRGSQGPGVVRLQRELNEHGAHPRLTPDGIFGPATDAAVRRFQETNAPPPDGIVGPETWAALAKAKGKGGADEGDLNSEIVLGKAALPPAAPPPASGGTGAAATPATPATDGQGVRAKVVAAALLGLANEPQIHYSQGPRRMEFIKLNLKPPKFPTYTDCSAFATWCYWSAGAPDPNGRGYDGSGYTGTLADHGALTKSPQPGDLVFYTKKGGHGIEHVAVFIGDGHVVSHGSEKGPMKLRTEYRTVHSIRSYL